MCLLLFKHIFCRLKYVLEAVSQQAEAMFEQQQFGGGRHGLLPQSLLMSQVSSANPFFAAHSGLAPGLHAGQQQEIPGLGGLADYQPTPKVPQEQSLLGSGTLQNDQLQQQAQSRDGQLASWIDSQMNLQYQPGDQQHQLYVLVLLECLL